jgi:hypothetical protein
VHLPSFNAYPLGYVTTIGEHLMTMPQQASALARTHFLSCTCTISPFSLISRFSSHAHTLSLSLSIP